MKIAVVILNWNGKALLEQFLPSVVRFSEEAAIYVADNASTDDSVDFLRINYPEVKIIQNKVNGGYARGYNDALPHVSEDIFILLNSDVEVTHGWLKPIMTEFETSSSTAALQPKILDLRKKDHFEYAGAAGGYIDRFGYPYCRGRIFTSLEKDEGQYDEPEEIFWASGACMAIRKEVFFTEGGFDEDFFAHQEEIDLCWRLFNSGYKIKALGASKVYHLGGGTLHSMHPRKTFYNFRNSLYALLKNTPERKTAFLILFRMILDGVAGVKFLAEGKPRHTMAILEAHLSFYSHFNRMRKKRKKVTEGSKYYHRDSVVIAYYIRKKRKFRDL